MALFTFLTKLYPLRNKGFPGLAAWPGMVKPGGCESPLETWQRQNKRLRLQRRLRGWSQDDVAAGLHQIAAGLGEPEPGVDATMISRWERGTRKPRPRYVRLLCHLFELPAEQLGVVEDSDFASLPEQALDILEDDDVERREFISKVAALLGVASLPMPIRQFEPASPEPWERLSRALRLPGEVDRETVDHLERVTYALETMGPTEVSAKALFGPVTGHLDAITLLLQSSLSESLRTRLCSLAAETAGYAGWLRWDMDDPEGASVYFQTGLEAAREAGDRALGAYLMASSACQPPYRENPEDRLRQLNGSIYGFTRRDATPASQVWLAAKEADAYALLGDADGCLRALDRAERALYLIEPGDEGARPRFHSVDGTWLEGERGASLAKLGRTAEARAVLNHVLATLGPSNERDRLWLFTSLASTYVQDREPEEACRVAMTTLDRASKMQLEPIFRMVQGIHHDLAAYGAGPAVRDLDEQLRTAVAVAAS